LTGNRSALPSGLPTCRITKLVQPKINFQKATFFKRPKITTQNTTFNHQLTTISPANYHQKTHSFLPTPLKNARQSTSSGLINTPQFFPQNHQLQKPPPPKTGE
jgi:hypothetical protein